MNENPSSSESPVSASAEPIPVNNTAPAARSRSYSIKALYGISALLAALLAAQWWYSQNELRELRKEIATRLQSSDAINAETKILVRATQESTRELLAKVNVLESRQAEAQSQQLALEQLYQELVKNHDDGILAEIEQVLLTASQQLQLAGNVQGALIALQNAENRLATSDKPQFIMVRRAIANDLERLRSLPNVDVTGIALRLDSLIAQVDKMPLLADEKPVLPATPPKQSRRVQNAGTERANDGAKPSEIRDWLATLEEKWQSWATEMWSELRQLVRIRNVEEPAALLLSPTQAYYVRENLKLRLMNARLSLLARNETAFRSDLIAAQDAITRYFDTRARQTQAAQAILKQVQGSDLVIEMPTLAESLSAVRNYKVKP